MKQKIYGVIPPISTPIDEHEHVDEKALRKLIDHCIDKGLHGIFVCGTNGECLGLSAIAPSRSHWTRLPGAFPCWLAAWTQVRPA